jgi:DNA-binding NtrC family response regulator
VTTDRILIVEDEKLLRWSLKERLVKEGFEVLEADSGAAARPLIEAGDIDLAVLDYRLPDATGIDLLKQIAAAIPETPVILMTAYSTVETAVEAMKIGAFDYLNKPFNQEDLLRTVRKALEMSRLRREVRALRRQQEERYGQASIVGDSAAMKEVFNLIHKVGRSAASTVLITGESGTGKDLVAKAIHHASDRAGGPFMNITCSALPENLLESELMGHERGSFTDAKSSKQGLFELASGGTVFLDEIGDMGILLQAKLLRLLEEKTFRRVGGVKDIKVDVRVIAATNRDLARAVAEGRFREDLYYRLKVIPIVLPALRDRPEDIPLLARHLMDQFNQEFRKHFRGITDDALALLQRHPWPGNVRELRNVIERAMILEDKEMLDVGDLPEEIRSSGNGAAPATGTNGFRMPESGYPLERMEQDLLRQALQRTAGNQTRAARLLSISRDALRYKMKKFGL